MFRFTVEVTSVFTLRSGAHSGLRILNDIGSRSRCNSYLARTTLFLSWFREARKFLLILVFLLNVVPVPASVIERRDMNASFPRTVVQNLPNNFSVPLPSSSNLLPLDSTRSSSNSLRNRIIKFCMRSQRKRRSLGYYMSADEKFAVHIRPRKTLGSTVYHLSVTDDDKVIVAPVKMNYDDMVISVIAEPSKLKALDSGISIFRIEDNESVLIRRHNTSVFVCMGPSGVVTAERMINYTISDDCEWKIRISARGWGFQRVFTSDLPDTVVETQTHTQILPTATLSVFRNGDYHLASGWRHKLWQPEATWFVYKREFGHVFQKREQRNRSTPLPADHISSTSPTKLNIGDDADFIRLGDREVYTQDATAQEISLAYIQKQRAHCSDLTRNLTIVAYREIRESAQVISELRASILKLDARLREEPPVFRSHSLRSLIHRWLLLINARWERQLWKRLSPSGENTDCEANQWSAAIELNERSLRRSLQQLYHDFFLKTQHLATWSWNERRRWLERPRISSLFRFLSLKIPRTSQIKQALFSLRRYFNLSMSSGDIDLLLDPSRLLSNKTDSEWMRKVKYRAIWLKFEEIITWPDEFAIPKRPEMFTQANDVRTEIANLPRDSACFMGLYNIWRTERDKDHVAVCSLNHFILTHLSTSFYDQSSS